MILQNILNVMWYELKTLFRSWFFRIFSILALLFIFGINMGILGDHGGARWTHRAIAANIPYLNVLFINVAQAIIAVFLASDFLRRDKKLDTAEVIYTRPISNIEYVLGKTLGIIILFTLLVVAGEVMALIFNAARSDVPIVWSAYLFYPALISLPTLIFILGLSFVSMLLVKNQAVTFILLLGYIALTLFYFQDKLFGLLDYMAFNLPMVYSDFIGFAQPRLILLHRLSYLLLGLGLISATIFLISRLPNSKLAHYGSIVLAAILFGSGLSLAFLFYNQHSSDQHIRARAIALNNQYVDKPTVDVIANEVRLEQISKRLQVDAELTIRNTGAQEIDTLVFTLNHEFIIDSITSSGGNIDFIQMDHLVLLVPAEPLRNRRRLRVHFYYHGTPGSQLANLDVQESTLKLSKRIMAAPLDKLAGIVHPDFLLLPPEMNWLPTSGVTFNQKNYLLRTSDFVRYTLHVKPNEGLIPVAPGKVIQKDGWYTFSPERDLNALTLVAGNYKNYTVNDGSVDYNLYVMPGHDFFSSYFTHLTDTLGKLIDERRENYEVEDLDLYYSFNRLNIVEVPVQFHAYEHAQVQTNDWITPEMVILPEKGAGLSSVDFSRISKFASRQNKREENTKTDIELEAEMFSRFVEQTFVRASLRMGRDRRDELIDFEGNTYTRNPFQVFPLFYTYVNSIDSKQYPVFNAMVEWYLKEGFSVSPRQTFSGGMTDVERANLALEDAGLYEIFGASSTSTIEALINQTGSYVLLGLKNRVGASEFDNFFYFYLEDRAFSNIDFEQFARDFYNEFEVDIHPYFSILGSAGKLPRFLVSAPDYVQSRDEYGEFFIVRYRVTNNGDSKGMVDVTYRLSGGGFMSNANTEKRLYEVEAGQTLEIQNVLYEQPRMMTINTLISANIPSSYSVFLRSAREMSVVINPEEFSQLTDKAVTLIAEGEIVVDNEDEGFTTISVSKASKLKQLIESRKPFEKVISYENVSQNLRPALWLPVAHTAFFGESIRSAMICRNGDGQNKAIWKAALPEAGFYDIYAYIPTSAMMGRPEGDRGNSSPQGGGSNGPDGSAGGPGGQGGQRRGPVLADKGYIYHYTIESNEGSETVEFEIEEDINDGWNKIATVHFPADTATIMLSNQVNGRRVFADAVKWVKRE